MPDNIPEKKYSYFNELGFKKTIDNLTDLIADIYSSCLLYTSDAADE